MHVKSGHYRPSEKTSWSCRFAGGPIVASDGMLAVWRIMFDTYNNFFIYLFSLGFLIRKFPIFPPVFKARAQRGLCESFNIIPWLLAYRRYKRNSEGLYDKFFHLYVVHTLLQILLHDISSIYSHKTQIVWWGGFLTHHQFRCQTANPYPLFDQVILYQYLEEHEARIVFYWNKLENC